jgi:hypothetical protein
MYTIKGKLKTVNDTQKITDSFSKREFVILDESGQYPQTIMFQSVQDKCDLVDAFKLGDSVVVFFNLRGRVWTNPQGEVKVFNTLDAWKIQKVDGVTTPSVAPVEEVDNLPF